MVSPPDGIDVARHRDAAESARLAWARRGFLGVLAGLCVLALVGVFGQEPRTSTAVAPQATLRVEAPTRVRGGLFFEGRFTVEAAARIEHATLVLDKGVGQTSCRSTRSRLRRRQRRAATGCSRSTSVGSSPATRLSPTCSSRRTRRASADGHRESGSRTASGCSRPSTGRSPSSPRPWISSFAQLSSTYSSSC
jgi:hypothetical protein